MNLDFPFVGSCEMSATNDRSRRKEARNFMTAFMRLTEVVSLFLVSL